MKTIQEFDNGSDDRRWLWWCPGCDRLHIFDKRWTMTGTPESPTFDGSYLAYASSVSPRCHSFVRNGQIEYLGDSEHALRGQTVPMVDIPQEWTWTTDEPIHE